MSVDLDSTFISMGVNFQYPSHLDDVDPLTVCMWIYPRGWGQSNFGRIASKEGSGTGWLFFVDNSTATAALRFLRYRSTTDTDYKTPNGAISLNVWQHVAVTYTSTGTHLFINGYEYTSAGFVGAGTLVSDSTAYLYAGNRTGYARGFNGNLCGYQVYDRVLDDAEIHNIWACRGADMVADKLFNAPMNDGQPDTLMGTDYCYDRTWHQANGQALYTLQSWRENPIAEGRMFF